jgi:hypothetical protein
LARVPATLRLGKHPHVGGRAVGNGVLLGRGVRSIAKGRKLSAVFGFASDADAAVAAKAIKSATKSTTKRK